MHRFVLSRSLACGPASASAAAAATLTHARSAMPALQRSISTSSPASSDADAAPAHPVQSAAASLLKSSRHLSSSSSFIQHQPRATQINTTTARSSKKLRLQKPPKNVPPLLSRLWGKKGGFTSLSPEDWKNLVVNNRQRLLQQKEKEQFLAFKRFKKAKDERIQWLKEQGQEPSAEMWARIHAREAAIADITKEARERIKSPIPPLPTLKKKQSAKAAAMSRKAKANPQHYLPTTLPNTAFRLFTFRLTHYHSAVLHRQQDKFREMARKLGLSPSKPTYLPHKLKKFDIIRSPHVDKTSREQYETRFYSLKIHISPSVDKMWAVKRLHELTFRLTNGNVKMIVETPPNLPIESLTFAPDPTKDNMGHKAPQQYATRDSPGIENILYKFDQHQFPFLQDWQEEILDEKFRGIYPKGFDPMKPFPLDHAFDKEAEEGLLEASEGDADSEEGAVFDEEGEFSEEEVDFEEDEDLDEALRIRGRREIDDERTPREQVQDIYDQRVPPLVKRKRRYE